MRPILALLVAVLFAAPVLAQEPARLSSPAISRCAGKAGLEIRQMDAAFGIIMLDGAPWLTIEQTEEKVGTQPISTTVTGTGAQRRRNGTMVPFRFTCLLDEKGEALMFHISQVVPAMGDRLPPSIFVTGAASTSRKVTLPRGAELRLELLDVAHSPDGEVLAEQVVRSGWQVPIPFELRLPKDTKLDDRKLVLTARLVVQRRVIFQLTRPRPIAVAELRNPIELSLDEIEVAKERK